MVRGPKRSAGVCTSYNDYDLIDTRAALAQRGRFNEPEKLGLHVARSGDYLGNKSDSFHQAATNALAQSTGRGGRYYPEGPDMPHPSIKPRGPRPY
ncbi:MAG: hypothetical protein BGO43_02000 [Gammaproteobacteria bacterium 39-13]|nr:hypothetical protein [Gammaproteobacteria bacterium]OJV91854.1 MAG: hypothetical protein BGO43_02000 [Gammaproteobacteria bacterium 39-13]